MKDVSWLKGEEFNVYEMDEILDRNDYISIFSLGDFYNDCIENGELILPSKKFDGNYIKFSFDTEIEWENIYDECDEPFYTIITINDVKKIKKPYLKLQEISWHNIIDDKQYFLNKNINKHDFIRYMRMLGYMNVAKELINFEEYEQIEVFNIYTDKKSLIIDYELKVCFEDGSMVSQHEFAENIDEYDDDVSGNSVDIIYITGIREV